MMSFAAKMRSHEYVEALEEERKKIMVFQRELPLCLEIITQVIESSKQQQMSGTTTTECMHGGQSECSEHTSSEAPLELVFLKKNSAKSESDDDSDEQHSHKNNNNNDHKRKADWLRLGTQTTLDLPSNEEHVPRKVSVIEAKRNGGAFQPFNREKNVVKTNNNQLVSKAPSSVPAASTGSSVETGTAGNGGNVADKKDDKGQTQRKQRRCWSPELHRRFLQALQQLGGPDAATPKQIREHMKVDGLTNDEVKSHLQKYRLHTRRVSPTIHNNGTSSQAPQLVLVGSLWMPPEYSTMAATGEASNVTTPPNGIYAPVATSPAPKMQKTLAASLDQKVKQNQSEGFSSEEKCSSHSEGHAHSNSPSTSSSTHTTTASPLS